MLALRVHAIDIARAVLRTCQQLHGAAGVCDEYDISVLTRHIQPALRLPFGAERTAAELADGHPARRLRRPVRPRRAPVTTFEGPPLDDVQGIGALTMGGFLDDVAERFAANEALVFDDPLLDGATVRWTYADLEREAHRVGRGLLDLGLERATASPSSWATGPRPLPRSSARRWPALSRCRCRRSRRSPSSRSCSRAPRSRCCSRRTGSSPVGSREDAEELQPKLPLLRHIATVGTPSWDSFLGGAAAPDVAVAPDDDALIIFSSGTTSPPKGMLHSHRAPTLQFWIQSQIFGRHEGTRMWTALPMFWTAGLNTAMGATLAAGGCWVMQETFEPGQALALMAASASPSRTRSPTRPARSRSTPTG